MECSPHIAYVSPIWLVAVLAEYLWFAGQLYVEARHERRALDVRALRTVGAIVAVFVVCGIAHNTRLLPEAWQWLAHYVYPFLALLGLVLVTTNQARRLIAALAHD